MLLKSFLKEVSGANRIVSYLSQRNGFILEKTMRCMCFLLSDA